MLYVFEAGCCIAFISSHFQQLIGRWLDLTALINAYDVMPYVIPGRPGMTFAHSRFPGIKKRVRECKP